MPDSAIPDDTVPDDAIPDDAVPDDETPTGALLRLFPLEQTVLFPGAPITLTVFEPRYRQLLYECLQERVPFGIALLRSGREVGGYGDPHEVGTTARIGTVGRLPDGRLRLEAIGERRFRIERLDHTRPYLRAEVSYPVDDGAHDLDPERLTLARQQQRALRRLRGIGGSEYHRRIALPDAPGPLTDDIAHHCGGPPATQQRVLETLHLPQRLDRVLEAQTTALRSAHRHAQLRTATRWGSIAARN